MKFLQILILIFGLTVLVNAQHSEKGFILSGTIFDPVKAVISTALLTAKHKDGRVFKTVSKEDGLYSIKLPLGKYTLEFSRDGFKNYIVQNFEKLSATDEQLDIDFRVRHCDDCNGDLIGERDENELRPTIVDYKKIKNKRKNNN